MDILKRDKLHKKLGQQDHSSSDNHQNLFHYQILGGKTLKNIQINPQTTDTDLNVM